MKIKKGFMLRKVGEQNVVVAVGAASRNFNDIIRLNDSGRYLWEKLQGGVTQQALVQSMLEDYDVDESTASAAVAAFIKKLEGAGLLE